MSDKSLNSENIEKQQKTQNLKKMSRRGTRFLSYVGGKFHMAKTISNILPKHVCYCEVFGGAGHVFFYKEPSKIEVINDINKELINLYRVIQNHFDEFIRCLEWTLVSRNEFDRQKRCLSDTLTDIQRAIRFYYLLKCAYGGEIISPTFGYSKTRAPHLDILKVKENLAFIHSRLARVTIECLPYANILHRYDSSDSLFYLDPPYECCEDYYGKGIFSKDDFTIIKDILSGIKGKFILSINDTPNIREIFKGFNLQEVQVFYSYNGKGVKSKHPELLITNFKQ